MMQPSLNWAPPKTSDPISFRWSLDSPVSIASLQYPWPSMTVPSHGMVYPLVTLTKSPSSINSTYISSSFPSKLIYSPYFGSKSIPVVTELLARSVNFYTVLFLEYASSIFPTHIITSIVAEISNKCAFSITFIQCISVPTSTEYPTIASAIPNMILADVEITIRLSMLNDLILQAFTAPL